MDDAAPDTDPPARAADRAHARAHGTAVPGTDGAVEREAAAWVPLVEAARELIDACVMSAVDDVDELAAAQADIESAVARLDKIRLDKTLGLTHSLADRRRPWGNPVIGIRNPMAPPLTVISQPNGRTTSDFHCGGAYEGPAGLVHGGVVSMLLDQVLGHAVAASGLPGMTGTLTITYRQGTPLGDLRAEAWVARRDRGKIWAEGHILGPDGVTAQAEGLFIVPRALREAVAAAEATGGEVDVPAFFE